MITKNSTLISFQPKQDQVEIIKNWLIEEEKASGEGFYCNWEFILPSFYEKRGAILLIDKNPVGFATWRYSSKHTATINYAEIKDIFRNNGYGKQLMLALFEKFIKENIYTVELQCSPASSEIIWRHLGFTDFPKHEYRWNGRNKELYKILIPYLCQKEYNDEKEFIELWNDEPYRTSKLDSTWKWELKFNEGTRILKNPIIYPCHYDWRIRWTAEGKVIKDDKIKYFSKGEFYFGGFLIVNDLLIT